MRTTALAVPLGALAIAVSLACSTQEPVGQGGLPGDIPRVTPPDDAATSDDADGAAPQDAAPQDAPSNDATSE